MNRYAGVLMAVTSLPSRYGIGCFDKAAYEFVDWLESAGQRYWQILPLSATSHGGGADSPYQSYSAFAGNPYFISLDALVEEGVLTRQECDAVDFGTDARFVDYRRMNDARLKLLRQAYQRSNVSRDPGYHRFCAENGEWLPDYALFMALKDFFGGQAYSRWPEDIRMHWGFALDYYNRELYFEVEFQKYLQYKFYAQWSALKAYANARHIEIVGDIPIYVSEDCADVWAHPELFRLDGNNRLTDVAGCPPDAFAADGQVWGNPLYRWDYHRATGYAWWVSRMRHCFKLYDLVRIDHFRGFDEFFVIPADTRTAASGHWEKGPGMELFHAIRHHLGDVKVVAEDLGLMTEGVRKLVRDSGCPNMKVLQFAVDPKDVGASNDYWPHNYGPNCVVYTGTHDNDTTAGWFEALSGEGRAQVRDYLSDYRTPDDEMYWQIINLAMISVARDCIIPIQDYLGLGNDARMNQPGTMGRNWAWRLLPGELTPALAERMLAMAKRTARANWDAIKARGPVVENA